MLHFNFIQFQCCGDASLAKVIVQTNIILSNVYTNILDLRGVYKPRRLMRGEESCSKNHKTAKYFVKVSP